MIAALFALAALGPAQSAAIDAAVERERKRQHAAAVSIALARDGQIVYAKGYGQADPVLGISATPRTIYAIGSITKQFTAALVMRLVERGDVQLDAKISTYLPDVPHGDEIEVRYLLDQRSGLPDFLGEPSVQPYVMDPKVTPAQLVALVAGKPLAFAPGSAWAYSNTNYVILGMLVEKVAGAPYESVLEREILRPLGLNSTTTAIPAPGPRVAVGQSWSTMRSMTEPAPRWSSQVAYAAGELNSDVLDLIAWDRAFFGGRVVSAESLHAMTTPPVLASGASDTYGFGWISSSSYGRSEIWHNGGIPGFSARNAYFPQDRLAIVVLANNVEFDAGPIVREALAQLSGISPAERAAFDKPSPVPGEDPKIDALARAQFEAFAAGNVVAASYSPQVNAALTPAVVTQVRDALRALGALQTLTLVAKLHQGPYETWVYKLDCANGSIKETLSVDANGIIGGIFFGPWDS